MGINRPVDKLIVQVFEMIKAGKSHSQIGDFFHHTHQSIYLRATIFNLEIPDFRGVPFAS